MIPIKTKSPFANREGVIVLIVIVFIASIRVHPAIRYRPEPPFAKGGGLMLQISALRNFKGKSPLAPLC
jgi:hypothetical protein